MESKWPYINPNGGGDIDLVDVPSEEENGRPRITFFDYDSPLLFLEGDIDLNPEDNFEEALGLGKVWGDRKGNN